VTGAATATINRLPVLLLPGDVFANRLPAPVLQKNRRAATPIGRFRQQCRHFGEARAQIRKPDNPRWSTGRVLLHVSVQREAPIVSEQESLRVVHENYGFRITYQGFR